MRTYPPGPLGVRKWGAGSMPKLTDDFIKTFAPPPGAKDRLVFDTEVKGLGIRATASGSKMFLVQWTDKATGKKVRDPLGAWGTLTVKAARDAARAQVGRVASGVDVKAEREARRAEDAKRVKDKAEAKAEADFTLDKLIGDWVKLHLASRRPRYSTEAERALRVAFQAHLSKPAAALLHGSVLAVLDGMASEGRAPMAGRTMAYGRACYGWAVKRRRLAANPFQGLPVIEGAAPVRDRFLTDDEVGAVWRAAGELGHPFRQVVLLLLLTAQRREEVAAMRWSEVAPDLSAWTLPAGRAKNGKAHIVHLSEQARAILASVPRNEGQDLVFSTNGKTVPSGFSRVKLALDGRMPDVGGAGWRFHDFRRTAVTWGANAGFPPHVADRLLNHVGGTISGVAAVYQMGEFLAERRALLEGWAAHVLACGEGQMKGDPVANLAAERTKRAKRA